MFTFTEEIMSEISGIIAVGGDSDRMEKRIENSINNFFDMTGTEVIITNAGKDVTIIPGYFLKLRKIEITWEVGL